MTYEVRKDFRLTLMVSTIQTRQLFRSAVFFPGNLYHQSRPLLCVSTVVRTADPLTDLTGIATHWHCLFFRVRV